MKHENKAPMDAETILITLDQIGQTVDVLNSVVQRLRCYVTHQIDRESHDAAEQVIASDAGTHSLH